MRRVERQMLGIILVLLLLLILGFFAGYKLLPASRLSLLFGAQEQLLEAALPFQTALAQESEPELANAAELLLHNAGLPTMRGMDLQLEAEVAAFAELEAAAEPGEYPDKNEPPLIVIEEAAITAQAGLLDLRGDAPLIAVYCSHSSGEYSDGARISGLRGGVHTVAETLADALNQLGLPTIYCDTVHDSPDWNMSYVNSLASIQRLKEEYPSIEVFIDVHRDAETDSILTTAGGNLARMMLVIGTNERLEHPNWQQNYSFAQQVERALESRQSGISRGIITYAGRYNQHLTTKSILVEVGSQANTTAEAKASALLLAQAIYDVLHNQ